MSDRIIEALEKEMIAENKKKKAGPLSTGLVALADEWQEKANHYYGSAKSLARERKYKEAAQDDTRMEILLHCALQLRKRLGN